MTANRIPDVLRLLRQVTDGTRFLWSPCGRRNLAHRGGFSGAAALVLVLALTVLSLTTACQKPSPNTEQSRAPKKAGLVAVIASSNRDAYMAPVEPFEDTLGREVNLFNLEGKKDADDRAAVAVEVAKMRPPLIFAVGRDALELARERLPKVPVVFAMVINWKHHGLLKARNVTGIAFEVPPEVQFTQLKMVAPKIRRIGVIHSRDTLELVDRARKVARNVNVEVKTALVSSPAEVPKAWAKLRGQIDAIWMIPDGKAFDNKGTQFLFLKDAAISARLPFLGASDSFVKAGCLMSLSADYESIGSQAAILADRILEGEIKPVPQEVQSPAGTILTVNVKTAKAIGLAIDDAVLDFADSVVGDDEEAEEDE
ncbi:ABC transporter substrate-binding protein [Planctomycetota bacterium]